MNEHYPAEWELPTFEETVLGDRRTDYCLIIPVLNEGERIRKQLRDMRDRAVSGRTDIIIADGGSNDNALNSEFLSSLDVRALLVKTGPGRLSAQLRMGYAWALKEGYAGIITMDGNGKDSIESIPDFILALDQGFDYVQASRFIKGGRGINTPIIRLLAIRLIHAPLVSLAAGLWLTDTTQGFRAYSARYLLHPKVQPFRNIFSDYELLVYLSARAKRIGLRTKETPTFRTYPASGRIPTKISGIKGNLDILKTIGKLLSGVYNPD